MIIYASALRAVCVRICSVMRKQRRKHPTDTRRDISATKRSHFVFSKLFFCVEILMKVKSGMVDLCFLVGHSFHFWIECMDRAVLRNMPQRYISASACVTTGIAHTHTHDNLNAFARMNKQLIHVAANSFTKAKNVDRNTGFVFLCVWTHKIKDSCRIVSSSFTNALANANKSMGESDAKMSQFNQLHASTTPSPSHRFFSSSIVETGTALAERCWVRHTQCGDLMLTPDSKYAR